MLTDRIVAIFLLAAGWRWAVFEYKKMEPVRRWLSQWGMGRELLCCPFCQFCQSGLVAVLVLAVAGAGSHPLVAILQILTTGFWGSAAYPFLDAAIEKMESVIENSPVEPSKEAPFPEGASPLAHIEQLIQEFHSAGPVPPISSNK